MALKDVLPRIDRRLKRVGKSDRQASLESGKEDRIAGLRRRIKRGQGEGDVHERTLQHLARPLKTTARWLDKGEGPEEIEYDAADPTTMDGKSDKRPSGLVIVDAAALRRMIEGLVQGLGVPDSAVEHVASGLIAGVVRPEPSPQRPNPQSGENS